MPERISNNYGQTIHHVWDVMEYTKYAHTRKWYMAAGVFLVLCIGYAVFSANYLFAFILILISAIFVYHELREPAVTQVGITDKGLVWRGFLFPYKEVDSFWLVYNPTAGLKNLHVSFRSPMTPRLSIPLEDQDPVAVRETLLQYIEEDTTRDQEPLLDTLGRVLKL